MLSKAKCVYSETNKHTYILWLNGYSMYVAHVILTSSQWLLRRQHERWNEKRIKWMNHMHNNILYSDSFAPNAWFTAAVDCWRKSRFAFFLARSFREEVTAWPITPGHAPYQFSSAEWHLWNHSLKYKIGTG